MWSNSGADGGSADWNAPWAFQQSTYQNYNTEDVDWAQLAQQWIQMKDNQTTPGGVASCPPPAVPLHPPLPPGPPPVPLPTAPAPAVHIARAVRHVSPPPPPPGDTPSNYNDDVTGASRSHDNDVDNMELDDDKPMTSVYQSSSSSSQYYDECGWNWQYGNETNNNNNNRSANNNSSHTTAHNDYSCWPASSHSQHRPAPPSLPPRPPPPPQLSQHVAGVRSIANVSLPLSDYNNVDYYAQQQQQQQHQQQPYMGYWTDSASAISSRPPPTPPFLMNHNNNNNNHNGGRTANISANAGMYRGVAPPIAPPVIDSNKRRALPAWIRVGLENMDEQKRRDAEREAVRVARLQQVEERRRQQLQAASTDRTGSPSASGKSRFDSSEDESDEEQAHDEGIGHDVKARLSADGDVESVSELGQSASISHQAASPLIHPAATHTQQSSSTHNNPPSAFTSSATAADTKLILSVEERQELTVLMVRRLMTEFLLDVTSSQIQQVASETLQSTWAAKEVQQKVSVTVSVRGLGLDIYDSGSESDSTGDGDLRSRLPTTSQDTSVKSSIKPSQSPACSGSVMSDTSRLTTQNIDGQVRTLASSQSSRPRFSLDKAASLPQPHAAKNVNKCSDKNQSTEPGSSHHQAAPSRGSQPPVFGNNYQEKDRSKKEPAHSSAGGQDVNVASKLSSYDGDDGDGDRISAETSIKPATKHPATSSDKKSDKSQISSDKKSDKVKISSEKSVDINHTSSERKPDKNQTLSDKNSDKNPMSSEKIPDKNPVSSDKKPDRNPCLSDKKASGVTVKNASVKSDTRSLRRSVSPKRTDTGRRQRGREERKSRRDRTSSSSSTSSHSSSVSRSSRRHHHSRRTSSGHQRRESRHSSHHKDTSNRHRRNHRQNSTSKRHTSTNSSDSDRTHRSRHRRHRDSDTNSSSNDRRKRRDHSDSSEERSSRRKHRRHSSHSRRKSTRPSPDKQSRRKRRSRS